MGSITQQTVTSVSDPKHGSISAPSAVYVEFTGNAGSYVSTPDSATVSVTGDIEIIARLNMTDWTPASSQAIEAKYLTTGNQRSFEFYVATNGRLVFALSPDGTGASLVSFTSSASPTVSDNSVLWVRLTLDVNNGAADSDGTYYTSTTDTEDPDKVTWTQLGTVINGGSTVSIFDGTAPLTIGATATSDLLIGNVLRAIVKDGIGGTIVSDFNPLADYSGGSTLTSSATGEVWTLNGDSAIDGDYGITL